MSRIILIDDEFAPDAGTPETASNLQAYLDALLDQKFQIGIDLHGLLKGVSVDNRQNYAPDDPTDRKFKKYTNESNKTNMFYSADSAVEIFRLFLDVDLYWNTTDAIIVDLQMSLGNEIPKSGVSGLLLFGAFE